jgi:pyruvate kinase
MKKTKVIATVGPASDSIEILESMMLNGMDIVRVNMSHATQAFLKHIVDTINELNKKLNKNVSVMVDTNGPTIQIGHIDGGHTYLNKGDKIRIYETDIIGNSTRLSIHYEGLLQELKVNTTLKMNDGLVVLNVVDKGHDYLLCEVIEGGYIEEYRKVNIIGTKLNIPFLTEKDKADILYASKLHVDYLALSFVNTHEDVLEVNDLLINAGDSHMTIISKIESANALDDLEDIIKMSDGIMVARGDLGVEIPLERIPGLQKQIINKCHYLSKVSIVATEMLASMEEKIRPTRAEVSDIAQAVLEGVDAVMLTGETTIGRYPKEVLETMSKIVETVEEDINHLDFLSRTYRTEKQDTTGSIAYSVVECSMKLKTSAIVAPTMSGYTARKLSRFRPASPIIALSPDIDTVKSLNIYYGVYPVLIDNVKNFDDMMTLAKQEATKLTKQESPNRIIITGGYPFKEVKHTNFMKIEDL